MPSSPAAHAALFSSSTTLLVTAPAQGAAPNHITVKLKARRRRVRWAEDVVDNEEMSRKKSKCCCVFHRPRGLDESSGDEGEDEESRLPSVPCDVHGTEQQGSPSSE